MINGLWSGISRSNVSNIQKGSAVLVFQDGRIYGGNSIGYMLGSYQCNGERVTGELTATHYCGDPLTIFGLVGPGETLQYRFEATCDGELLTGEGFLKDNPKLRTQFEFIKRADL